ncbi:hypothetical protein [Aeromicrobium sp. HA]|uniref:hypothetical protein n=1 Tax=Aeromicrobium sp. HA TaxID=3009077 RepID=UPI0022B05811|nr:hypothetical protein [Aeromicrobium sp. HA]
MTEAARAWERLLSALSAWATVADPEPGRIRVRFVDATGSPRQVEIVMGPESWADWVDIMWASPEQGAREVKETLLGLDERYRYLVYETYGLEPSETEELPPDDVLEWLRAHPRGGRWVVLNEDGTVRDEF